MKIEVSASSETFKLYSLSTPVGRTKRSESTEEFWRPHLSGWVYREYQCHACGQLRRDWWRRKP